MYRVDVPRVMTALKLSYCRHDVFLSPSGASSQKTAVGEGRGVGITGRWSD